MLTVGSAILVLMGIARAQQYPDYQPLAASQYPSYQEHQGIGAAVIPMFDRSSQERYLGADFLAHGFLPVYIEIQNRANPQSAVLLRDQVHYSHDGSAAVSEDQRQARPSPSGLKKTVAEQAVQLATFPPTPLFLPTAFVALHWASKISEVRMNLLKKELRSQTVAPGKSGGGFLFAPLGADRKASKEVFLDIPIRDGASDEDIHFYFRIDMRPEGK
jgi:hypothetical protein